MKQHSFSAPLALGDGSADRLQRRPQSSQGRVLPVKFSPSPGETSGNLRLVSTDTMASADFSAFTPPITGWGAAVLPPPHVSEISPGKDAALPRTAAAFTSTTEPIGFAVLCQLAPSCRPCMRFLFISSRVSPSLPPHGRSPFRGWLQLVFCLYGSYTGDLNPFWAASMLGAHKSAQPMPGGRRGFNHAPWARHGWTHRSLKNDVASSARLD
jgi:hypothetical protein